MTESTGFVWGLALVVLVSTTIAALLGLRGRHETPVKVMLFVGYFWLSAFVQLLLIAGIAHLAKF